MSAQIDVMLSEDQIQERIKGLASEIRKDFGNEEIILLCILKGSYIFCADLMRALGSPCQVEFLRAESYGDATETSGEVKLHYHFTKSLAGKNVILVEDIVDTGTTLKFIMESMKNKEQPKTLKLASLLSKPSRRVHETQIDYLGFEIEDKFVIGYGLDYAQNYRELPYIGVYQGDAN